MMNILLKKILDFYINSSLHVAFSIYALLRVTEIMFQIPKNIPINCFAFFGTIVGYNFVKYDALARIQKVKMSLNLKAIALLSFLSSLLVGYFFFQLEFWTQAIAVAVLVITLLYTLPFFPNKKNARNWAGLKIYMVALCWVGVTLVLPIIDAGIPVSTFFFLKCIQRFILVFVLILIFEIIDLQYDDPHLKTVPQQIGVKNTKKLGYFLILLFCGLEFINTSFNGRFVLAQFSVILIISFIIALFLRFANEKKSKYYSVFWAESIPIFWWILLILFQ